MPNKTAIYRPPSYTPASERRRSAEREQGSKSASLYNTQRWRRESAAHRRRNPLCVHCEAAGRITAATVTDHIQPHKGDLFLFWDATNWQSLCKPCHDTKTATQDGGFGRGFSGPDAWQDEDLMRPRWLKASAIPLTILFGPPASGKSTLARTLQASIVIDIDTYYSAGIFTFSDVMGARNADLAKLATAKSGLAVFIVGAPGAADREWWVKKLRPTRALLVLADRDVCLNRIRDTRTGRSLARSVKGSDAWWTRYTPDATPIHRTDVARTQQNVKMA